MAQKRTSPAEVSAEASPPPPVVPPAAVEVSVEPEQAPADGATDPVEATAAEEPSAPQGEREPASPEKAPPADLPPVEELAKGLEELQRHHGVTCGAPLLAVVAGLEGAPRRLRELAEALAWALNTGASGPHASKAASASPWELAAVLRAAFEADVALDSVAAFLRTRYPAPAPALPRGWE